MGRFSSTFCAAGLLAFGLGTPGVSQDAPPVDRAGIDFFERRIRPVLVERCYTCHSRGAPKLKGGLTLDSRGGMLKGGNQGPAIVPGHPEKSLLIKAVRRADPDLQMPPKEELAPEQVADFEAWVKRGAPASADFLSAAAGSPAPGADPLSAKAESFWSFKAPREPALPEVRDAAWPRTPVDRFILAKLEEKGLRPSPPADRRTLLRRASYDLTGLPPTADEIEAFERDAAPDAYEKALDRLLASPHYGERWGRHWLDVARYADTKGDVFDEERRYPSAWTYRDWVIRAFNEDMPFERFVTAQIAADRLAPGAAREGRVEGPEDKGDLAALGFLTVGRRFNNKIHDIIDDRIDVVTRGFLGLTVTCARCHDHKYDPIPTKDYYSLYGVFASSVEPKSLPLLLFQKTGVNLAFEKELAARQAEADAFVAKVLEGVVAALRSAPSVTAHLAAVREARGKPEAELRAIAQKRQIKPFTLKRWKAWLEERAKGPDPVFGPWHALAAVSAEEFPAQAARAAAAEGLDPAVAAALRESPPRTPAELAERYGALLAGPLAALLKAPEAPPSVPIDKVEEVWSPKDRNKARDLRKKVGELEVTHPGAPPRAMVVEDAAKPTSPRVFVRGNPGTPGEPVPRRFLSILGGQVFKEGSGRLELARAIAAPENPLTARVFVNRVWLHHFGAGLVRTPSDFGTRGEPPTHPELLDWLAVWFARKGGSAKALHKLLMTSAVYLQSGRDNPEGRRADPENVLLWRMHRERLDLEALRDSVLAVSGRLDRAVGGRSLDLLAKPFPFRRTVYGLIDRQNLPGMFRAFDFASPDATNAQRFLTTVPQQALFLMNNPFVVEEARHLANRPDVAAEPDGASRVRKLYRLVYGRAPAEREVAAALRFVESEGKDAAPGTLSAWEEYVQVLLLSNEFAFVD
jgi:hypothetical protein